MTSGLVEESVDALTVPVGARPARIAVDATGPSVLDDATAAALLTAVGHELDHLRADDDAPSERHVAGPPARRARPHGTAAIAVDVGALTLAAVVATFVEVALAPIPAAHGAHAIGRTLAQLALCVPVLVVVLATTRRPAGALLRPSFPQQVHHVAMPIGAGAMACVAVWRVAGALGGGGAPSLDAVLLMGAVSLATVSAARLGYHAPLRRGTRRGRRVLVVGSGLVADRVSVQLAAAPGLEVVGFVDDDPKDPTGQLGSLSDLSAVCTREHIDHVVVAFSRSSPEAMIDVLRPVQTMVPITVVPRLFDILPATAQIQELASGFPGISAAPATLDRLQRAAKRSVDIAGAGLVLALGAPLLVAVAILIRLTSSGPVLLRQARVGRNGEVFSMLKFRTMHRATADPVVSLIGEPVLGPFPKLKRDPRVTTVGRVLRRLSLDELPQLFNVLSGRMSLIGPRPFIVDDAASIGGWALDRYSMRPGITGLWQVSGRNDLTYEEMCRLDHLYVSCWSLGLDARILMRTVRAVTAGRGAY